MLKVTLVLVLIVATANAMALMGDRKLPDFLARVFFEGRNPLEGKGN